MPGYTIPLVEDNANRRIGYRTMLERFGLRVLEARDGAEGIRRAREELPDAT